MSDEKGSEPGNKNSNNISGSDKKVSDKKTSDKTNSNAKKNKSKLEKSHSEHSSNDKTVNIKPVSEIKSVDKATPVAKKTADLTDSKTDTSTSSKETHATVETTPPAAMFNAKPMPKMQSNKSKRNWMVPSLVAFLLVMALLASGWTIYQQHLFKQNWLEQQAKINTQMSQQTQVIELAKNSGQASMQAANQTQLQLNQLTAKNQQLNDSLFSTQEKIKALSGRQKQDWMLAEAAYLIKIAQLQLSLQKDKETAIQLLKTADRRIIEIADNSLFPIREAIAKDLSELSLVLQPDVTGIALSLDALNHQIPSLNLLALQFEPIKQSLENDGTDNQVDQSQDFDLGKVYQNFLKDFVVIKDHSEPVKPLMTADQRINLNNNIQLSIQQAQIALVQGNATLYRLNLSNAIEWTNLYFKHDEKAKQVIDQLSRLKGKPIEVHYPNEFHAQKALNEISQQQLYHWLESSLSSPVPKTNIEPSLQVIEQPDELEENQQQDQQSDTQEQTDLEEQSDTQEKIQEDNL